MASNVDIETEMAGIKRRNYNSEYHKRHAVELKEKRRLRFLYNQQLKLERLKSSGHPIFTRKCPSCDTDLYYTNIRNLNVAVDSKSVCKHCCLKLNNVIPHNKGIYKRTEHERKILNWRRHLKNAFGITESEYNDIFQKQGGKCKICDTPRSELDRILYVDHCHVTNKIRGLLCRKCNAGLGHFNDNPIIIKNALEYLSN